MIDCARRAANVDTSRYGHTFHTNVSCRFIVYFIWHHEYSQKAYIVCYILFSLSCERCGMHSCVYLIRMKLCTMWNAAIDKKSLLSFNQDKITSYSPYMLSISTASMMIAPLTTYPGSRPSLLKILYLYTYNVIFTMESTRPVTQHV